MISVRISLWAFEKPWEKDNCQIHYTLSSLVHSPQHKNTEGWRMVWNRGATYHVYEISSLVVMFRFGVWCETWVDAVSKTT